MKKIKINVRLENGHDDIIGKPVFSKINKNIIGEIIEYDKETGNAILDIDEQMWNEILSTQVIIK